MAELLKFWTEKIVEIDTVERERPSLGLILEKTPAVISVARSSKRVELKMGNGNDILVTNLGVVWNFMRRWRFLSTRCWGGPPKSTGLVETVKSI